MRILLSCPSKTFLLGEYSVLNSGSALLFNSEPRFQLIADFRGSGKIDGISAASPAGQWLAEHHLRFSHIDIQFHDPHNGMGGFGASSAQFLLVHALSQLLRDSKNYNGQEESAVQIEPIWRDYRQLGSSASGVKPSGADIVSQFGGGLCEVSLEPFLFEKLSWPFEDHDVILARTGKKIATHEHLRDLRTVETDELSFILDQALDAFELKDAPSFFDAVNDYHAELLELGLVADHSQIFIATLLAQPFVKAVKGCGAMSSDTLAVFFAQENRSRVNKILSELQLPVVADLSAQSAGFKMQIDETENAVSNEGITGAGDLP